MKLMSDRDVVKAVLHIGFDFKIIFRFLTAIKYTINNRTDRVCPPGRGYDDVIRCRGECNR